MIAAPVLHQCTSPRTLPGKGCVHNAARSAAAELSDSTTGTGSIVRAPPEKGVSVNWTAAAGMGATHRKRRSSISTANAPGVGYPSTPRSDLTGRQQNTMGVSIPAEMGNPAAPRVGPMRARCVSPELQGHGFAQVGRISPHARAASTDLCSSRDVESSLAGGGAPCRRPLMVRSIQQPLCAPPVSRKSTWSDHWFLCQEKQEEDLKELNNYPPYEDTPCVPPHIKLRDVYTKELQQQSHRSAVKDWRASLCIDKKDEGELLRTRTQSEPRWMDCSASSVTSTTAGSTMGSATGPPMSSRGRSHSPLLPSATQREKIEDVRHQLAQLRKRTEIQLHNIMKDSNLRQSDIEEIQKEFVLAPVPAVENSPRTSFASPSSRETARRKTAPAGGQTYRKATSPRQSLQLFADIGDDLQHLSTEKLKHRLAMTEEKVRDALGYHCSSSFPGTDPHCEDLLSAIQGSSSSTSSKGKFRQSLGRSEGFAVDTPTKPRRNTGSDFRASFGVDGGSPPRRRRGSEPLGSNNEKLRQRLARAELYTRVALAAHGQEATPEKVSDATDIGFLDTSERLDRCIEEEPSPMGDEGIPSQEVLPEVGPPTSRKLCMDEVFEHRAQGEAACASAFSLHEKAGSASSSPLTTEGPSSSATLTITTSGSTMDGLQCSASHSCDGQGQAHSTSDGSKGDVANAELTLNSAALLQAFSRMSPEELSLIATALGRHLPPASS